MRALNLISDNKVTEVITELRKRRENSSCKKIDITRLFSAMVNDDFEDIKKSSFYRLHGGEYCELQQILYVLVANYETKQDNIRMEQNLSDNGDRLFEQRY